MNGGIHRLFDSIDNCSILVSKKVKNILLNGKIVLQNTVS